MIVIEHIQGSEYFSLNGKKYPQIYQAVAMGSTDVAIYSIHDIKNRLLGNTHYSEFTVNGVSYPNQDELITNLIPVLYQKGATSSSGGGDTTDWSAAIAQKEDKFDKNEAFNKNFGSSAGTVAEGNDPRFSQGTTAFGWGNHADFNYLTNDALPAVIDALTSTDGTAALSANQGRVLKGYIEDINAVLNSDDTTLDELQEIVNYIKQNKTDLQNLGISNIAGLQTALDNLNSKIDNHIGDLNNPHGVTKAQVGLGNVDNTSDLSKPISTATQTALNNKEPKFTKKTAFNKDFGTTAGTVKEGDWLPTWTEVSGKPSTYPPAGHTHTKADITDFAHTHGWNDILNKPTEFTPEAHTHSYTEITGKPTTFPPSAHNHDDRYYTEAEVDNKLATKSDTSHTHNWSEILNKPIVPSKTSQLTNDSGFITVNDVPDYNQNNKVRNIFINPVELPSNYTTEDIASYLSTNGLVISDEEIIVIEVGEGIYALGGTTTEITENGNNYRVHTFTSSGDFTISNGGEIEYFIVAGGGGGGTSTNGVRAGGGGGAGGVLQGSIIINEGATIPVTVGEGGAAQTNGGNSSFGTYATAIGGGAGGHGNNGSHQIGADGGSGGGGGSNLALGGSGISGQGNDGGTGAAGIGRGGGGGGGATSIGLNGDSGNHYGGAGGSGITTTFAGTAMTFAGGGGGAGAGSGAAGEPSAGAGGVGSYGNGGNATANSGSGGGGGYSYGSGGRGGSGIVMIRYRI